MGVLLKSLLFRPNKSDPAFLLLFRQFRGLEAFMQGGFELFPYSPQGLCQWRLIVCPIHKSQSLENVSLAFVG
jgi:hypothetical protein